MSRVEQAVEKVKHLDENQAEALLEWLELRQNREALRQRLDAEIEAGLTQLREGEKISGDQVYAEIRERSRRRRLGRMADHFYSPEARLDLLEIWEYIALDNIDAADRVVQEVERVAVMLVRNPELGQVRPDLTSKPVRFWAAYSYLIIYDPNARPLEIVRILSGYRDIATLLK